MPPATKKQVETHLANKSLRLILGKLAEGPESKAAQSAVDEIFLHCLSSGRIRQTLKAAGGVPPLQSMLQSSNGKTVLAASRTLESMGAMPALELDGSSTPTKRTRPGNSRSTKKSAKKKARKPRAASPKAAAVCKPSTPEQKRKPTPPRSAPRSGRRSIGVSSEARKRTARQATLYQQRMQRARVANRARTNFVENEAGVTIAPC